MMAMRSMSKSPVGYIFSAIRGLQLVAVIVTIPFLCLIAVRLQHHGGAPPYQIIYTLVVVRISLLLGQTFPLTYITGSISILIHKHYVHSTPPLFDSLCRRYRCRFHDLRPLHCRCSNNGFTTCTTYSGMRRVPRSCFITCRLVWKLRYVDTRGAGFLQTK